MWDKPAKGEALPWSWAEERLRTAETYWLSTVSAGGRPAVRPVWGVWLHDRLFLSLGSSTSWRNLQAGNGAVTVSLGDAVEVVIVDGTAGVEDDERVLADMCDAYNPKYAWNFELGSLPGVILRVEPDVVIAWKTVPVEDCTWDMEFPDASGRWVRG
jgi:hypothetical protein